ncbi:MAG: GNAT family N-acetyltransferase [Acidobacteria bacterium]|nr:GNAT family N-acetyltransferase [Acidobacteriota bacterium]
MMDLTQFAPVLLESDMAYFKLGARCTPLRGAWLARVPGLEHLAAGCILVDLDFQQIESDRENWLNEVTQILSTLNCPRIRFYVYDTSPDFRSALELQGLQSRCEIGFLGRPHASRPDCSVTLRPVETDAEWKAKPQLYHGVTGPTFGYQGPADDWVELERRKSSVGPMKTFVIQSDQTMCGSVSTIEVGTFLRIKSLFLRPEWQGKGIGLQVMNLMGHLAYQLEKDAFGIFAVAGSAAEKLYTRAGLLPLTQQHEWNKPLPRQESQMPSLEF